VSPRHPIVGGVTAMGAASLVPGRGAERYVPPLWKGIPPELSTSTLDGVAQHSCPPVPL
jgi:hypothetical protein